jgi:ribosome-binding protein aMBF1 (putative translation factor)
LSDIDSQIAAIKSRINSAQIQKVRAQAANETAQENYNLAMARLRTEFGVDSVEGARAKLAELQTDLQTKMAEVTNILDEIDHSKSTIFKG